MVNTRALIFGASFLLACGDDGGGQSSASATATETGPTASATMTTTTASGSETETTTSSTTGTDDGTKFDVPSEDIGATTGPIEMCKVVDDMDAVGDCREQSPPNSFEPDVQWQWMDQVDGQSVSIALVANLTDDNGDDEIDLCDVPDIVINAFANYFVWDGHIWVLDGETGTPHFQIPDAIDGTVTPALGDIDNDGISEILVANSAGNLVAFEHDGSLKWTSPSIWTDRLAGAIALADLEGDGDVEIIAGSQIFDHQGQLLLTLGDTSGSNGFGNATAVADLDGDDDQEIIFGRSAWHHDGSNLYNTPGIGTGYPQVADLDADPEPEVLLLTSNGITVFEHNGIIKFQDQRPTGSPPGLGAWHRPATVHDFDGDLVSEFAVSSQDLYAVYEQDATIVWTAPVADLTGVAAGTAFDFLGDGVAEAMYADEQTLYVYDGMGMPLLSVPRSSGTGIEYPVVADVDNDGSAEIVVVSNESYVGMQTAPAVQVVRDIQDRWIQARRIWNQHTYHVTNVREDGTIPAVEPKSWELLNTYRTNAQIEGGGICKPDPEG